MRRTVSTSASTPPRTEVLGLDDARWAAFVARDAAFDGQFVVTVKTTGIYCRPSCPARRPKRENVRFFATATEAERANLLGAQWAARAVVVSVVDLVAEGYFTLRELDLALEIARRTLTAREESLRQARLFDEATVADEKIVAAIDERVADSVRKLEAAMDAVIGKSK